MAVKAELPIWLNLFRHHGDWQSQANFLRNLSSPALGERFHRLGVNELRDLQGLDTDELAKALAAVNEKDDLGKEDVNRILLKVLKAEMESSLTSEDRP